MFPLTASARVIIPAAACEKVTSDLSCTLTFKTCPGPVQDHRFCSVILVMQLLEVAEVYF